MDQAQKEQGTCDIYYSANIKERKCGVASCGKRETMSPWTGIHFDYLCADGIKGRRRRSIIRLRCGSNNYCRLKAQQNSWR